jgi:tetratricopeptide (TPR) repeat protein
MLKKLYFCTLTFFKMAENISTEQPSKDVTRKVQSYFRENSKSLIIIGAAIVVIVGGYFAYLKLFKAPAEKKAMEAMWKAEYYFEKDSFQLAIDGTPGSSGFKAIAKKYSGTMGGNVASYCLGISYLNIGKYKEAIKSLEDCSFDDDIVCAIAIGAQGDAYREMDKLSEAIEKYEEAANRSENDFTTPFYLKKAGLAYEDKNNFKKAAELYERIYNDYEHTTEGRDIEKYLARAKSSSGK